MNSSNKCYSWETGRSMDSHHITQQQSTHGEKFYHAFSAAKPLIMIIRWTIRIQKKFMRIHEKLSFNSTRPHRMTGLLLITTTVNQETEETGKYNMKNADYINSFYSKSSNKDCLMKIFNCHNSLSFRAALLARSQRSNPFRFLWI